MTTLNKVSKVAVVTSKHSIFEKNCLKKAVFFCSKFQRLKF